MFIRKISILLLALTLLVGSAGCGKSTSPDLMDSDQPPVENPWFTEPASEEETTAAQPQETTSPTLPESQPASLPTEEILTITDPEGNILFQGTEREIFLQKLDLCGKNDYAKTANRFIEATYGVTDISVINYSLLKTNEKYYTESELAGYDTTILWLAKNEIYARHGRMFANEDLQEFFLTRMWYEPKFNPEEFDEGVFNDYEKKNLELLVKLEKGGGSAPTPSGDQESQALEGRLVELSGNSWTWDLDRDGDAETISYKCSYVNYSEEYTLKVDGDSVTEQGDSIVENLYITSMNGKTYQLLTFEYGPSDDPLITVWCWNGSNLVKAGYLCSSLNNLYISNKRIYCKELSNIIQTYLVDMEYVLDGFTLEVVDHEFYEMGNTITAKYDIPTYKEKGGSSENGIVLKAGSQVIVVGTDNYEWVKLQDVASGEYCWMKVVRGTFSTMLVEGVEYYITELFDHVRQAG